ncbi:reverse transcriptase family protein [Neisseria sp. Ec49-e6-T10]|uniref:reverse transcriptase family protein n=1 Tax=Neisseria sp. Ec49-e6-T10 TaxID=3140744 RepID=UPI003EBB3258
MSSNTKNLWKYCTTEHCKELLISFQLFGQTKWSKEKQITCLYTLSNHIQDHYLPISIPKRDGTLRQLHVPDQLLKNIQRNILHHILNSLPISTYAMAYHKGATILTNAQAHIQQPQILKLDIENFFGTIIFPMVYQYAFPNRSFPPAVRSLLTHLCCYKDYLPQGAPTSATISNLIMRPFDEYMGKWCKEKEIIYTRYCDDMIFSGEFNQKEVKNKVQNYLQAIGFNLNEKKTKLITTHHKQIVTGITVNQKPQVCLQYRKNLRQTIYYCLKFGVLSHLKRIKDTQYLPLGQQGIIRFLYAIQGKINFILQVNPDDQYFTQAKIDIKKLLKQHSL